MSFKNQVINGLRWSAFANISVQGLRFIILALLARLLLPAEVGLVAMTALITNFAEVLSDLGFVGALLQRKDLEERHLSSIFWVNLAFGFGLTAFFILAAPLIAQFYNEPILVTITMVTAFNFGISAFNDVQTVIIRRNLAFKRLAGINILAMLSGGVVAILMALSGFGLWSLVAKSLVQNTVGVLVMWFTTSWRPKFIFDFSAVRELMGFSLNLLSVKSLNYWAQNVDGVLIGRFLDSASLGLYNRAFSTMAIPITQIAITLNAVMLPSLANIQDDKTRMKQIILRAHRLIGFVTLPLMIGLAMVAEPFILAIYGPNWAGSVPVLQILALATITQPLTAPLDWIFHALGRMDIRFRWSLVTTGVLVASFLVGLQWGIMGVAAAYLIPNYILWPVTVLLSGRLVDLTLGEYLSNITLPFVFSLVMAAGIALISSLLPGDLAMGFVLVIEVTAGVLIYGFLAIGFRIQAYRDFLAVIRPKARLA